MRKASPSARSKPMTSIGWLHLADLHQTLRRPGWPSAQVRREVLADLASLHAEAGPWDLVIVAGDLSMRGAPEELEEAERTLDDLLDHLRALGSDPCLLAVPGNHDLVRADGPVAGLRALRRWHEDPQTQREFWTEPESPGRRLVDRALEPYERWWSRRLERGLGKPISHFRAGLLPGDFTATVDIGGVRVGIAGLCSTFLQVTGDDYEGRLSISPHQLLVAAGGDVPAWIAGHDTALLITHHGPHWLTAEDRRTYEEDINPAGRFAAHLTGHFHGGVPLIEGPPRAQIRCPSLFGLDSWEDRRGQPGQRRFGYNAARLIVEGTDSRIEVRPRGWTESRLRPASELAEVDRRGVMTIPLAPFPRVGDGEPSFRLEHAALRDALAAHYRSPEEPRDLAREVGLQPFPAGPGGATVDVWHMVVSEADRRGLLGDLVRRVEAEHPSTGAISQAWRALQSGSRPEARRSMETTRGGSDRAGDALYERLTDLLPAAFEAVIAMVSLQREVPSSAAPQATRAMSLVRLMEKREGAAGLARLAEAIRRAESPFAPLAPLTIEIPRAALRGGRSAAGRQLLDQETLSRVHQAALGLGLGRHALLAGLPARLVSSLPAAPSPAAQLLLDLQALNRAPPLADGSVPLLIWLTSARALSAGRPEGEVFRQAQDALRRSSSEVARRAPTRPTLIRLLTVMFSDERDFDGFVLDHFPAVYRRFTSGMSRAYRIGLLLDAAEPSDVVARLKRSHPSAFQAHQRVLDYEDPEDVSRGRLRGR